MSSSKSGNEGVFLIALVALILFIANSIKVDKDFSVTTNSMKYKIARFYGSNTHQPSKDVLDREAERIAISYGLDSNLFRALIRVESDIDPLAVSSAGARGIAQIMPFNTKRCGLSHPDELFDAINNLNCGAQILSEELEQHGDIYKALTVYNCGKVSCKAGKRYASKVIKLSKQLL